MQQLKAEEYQRFEDIKHIRNDGSEFWSARELAPALEYNKWENFHKVIKRAMIASENSGHVIEDDFPEVRKIVSAGATSKPVKDYELTRYACYLIVQNGDPRKEVIALGQTYFAIFQNAGYMGLYGGMDVDDIHKKKNLEAGQKILDYMGSTELIANLFRISQTEEKLRKDEIKGAKAATTTCFIIFREMQIRMK